MLAPWRAAVSPVHARRDLKSRGPSRGLRHGVPGSNRVGRRHPSSSAPDRRRNPDGSGLGRRDLAATRASGRRSGSGDRVGQRPDASSGRGGGCLSRRERRRNRLPRSSRPGRLRATRGRRRYYRKPAGLGGRGGRAGSGSRPSDRPIAADGLVGCRHVPVPGFRHSRAGSSVDHGLRPWPRRRRLGLPVAACPGRWCVRTAWRGRPSP